MREKSEYSGFDTFGQLNSDSSQRNLGCRGSDCGSVIAEFALVLGFLVLVVLSAFDFGRLLQQYFTLSQIAFEGARSASLVAGLIEAEELSVAPTEERIDECSVALDNPRAISKASCALVVGYFRAQKLIGMYGLSSRKVKIKISYDSKNIIKCSVSNGFEALFPLFRLASVSASTEIPYFGSK